MFTENKDERSRRIDTHKRRRLRHGELSTEAGGGRVVDGEEALLGVAEFSVKLFVVDRVLRLAANLPHDLYGTDRPLPFRRPPA